MGMTNRVFGKWRGSVRAAEKADKQAGKKVSKSRSAKHTYENRARGISSQLVTPGSHGRHSDSVGNQIRYAFNQDGSRLVFRQRWIAVPGGSQHRTRRAALKRCENGMLPHIDRFTV